jgi:hypothetical protein
VDAATDTFNKKSKIIKIKISAFIGDNKYAGDGGWMLQRLWDFGREGGGGWEEEDTLLSPLGVRAGCYISSGMGTTLRLPQEDLLGTNSQKSIS